MKLCAITGTNGYLGSRVKFAFEAEGWNTLELTRNPRPGSRAIPFQLGKEIPAEALKGVGALVHCAYDFKALSWRDIYETNVAGSEKLFRAARTADVPKIIYISSISAFEGCRSLYGRAKLEAERLATRFDAVSIRPGLIYGDSPGGMFGKLVRQVENSRFLPIIGGGRQIQYLTHEKDLCAAICDFADARLQTDLTTPVTIANEEPWTFRKILEEIARNPSRWGDPQPRWGESPREPPLPKPGWGERTRLPARLRFIPLPWRLVWAGIKTVELCGVRISFRSDSVVSLMNQNPAPDFSMQRKLGIKCRPFLMG